MELTDVHIVPMSGNRKTGPIPITNRSSATCPSSCPFLPSGEIGGCYGSGRIFATANRNAVTMDVEAATWKVRLGKDSRARYLRDRVVGDVMTAEGTLDREYIEGISQVARDNDLVPFGYTHGWREFTAEDVAFIDGHGYVMNASTETHEGAEQALAAGLPVVLVDDELSDGDLVAGRRVVTCPAETRDYVTCASCGLCAKADRPTIVRFHTHGVAKAKARRAVATARDREVAFPGV